MSVSASETVPRDIATKSQAFTPLPSDAGLSVPAQKAAYAALDQNIQALPQELQDMLLEATLMASLPKKRRAGEVPTDKPEDEEFGWTRKEAEETFEHSISRFATHDPEGRIWVDEDYNFPLALHVSRKTREKFAKFYYGNYTITGTIAFGVRTTFPGLPYHTYYYSIWRTLPQEHRMMVEARADRMELL